MSEGRVRWNENTCAGVQCLSITDTHCDDNQNHRKANDEAGPEQNHVVK